MRAFKVSAAIPNAQKNRSIEPGAVSKITAAQMRHLPTVPSGDGT
jgi:hypothetical protein